MDKSIYTAEYRLFVRLLRKAREEASLTQEYLAEKLGQTQSFISKCERGERRLDLVETRAFCAAIGVDFTDLVQRFDSASEALNKSAD